jgi:probable phosphoglycerate mutase
MQTASKVVEELGLSSDIIECESRLMECNFGLWEGLTEAEIKRRFPGEWAARASDHWNTPAPAGESYADVNARVLAWYRGTSLAEATIVVCHGLTSRVFRGIYSGLSEQAVFELPEPQNGFFEMRNGISTLIED